MSAYGAFHANKYRRRVEMLCLVGLINGTITAPGPVKIPIKDSLLGIIMKKLVLSLSLVLAFSSATAALQPFHQKFVSVPILLMRRSNRKMPRGEIVGFFDIHLAKRAVQTY